MVSEEAPDQETLWKPGLLWDGAILLEAGITERVGM